jgi:outer membrane immunogenic protein
MHKFSASLAASALTLFIAAPASATDLGTKGDPTSAHYVSPAFQGVGIGVHGGGQFTNIDIYDQFDGIGADGLIGGAHAEYLFAVGGNFRVGLYAEGGISNVNTEIGGFDLLNQDWYTGAGIKAGPVFSNSTLVYGKLGYEYSKWSIAEDAAEADVESVVVGGGVETMIAENVSLGLEANYVVPLSIEVESKDVTDYLEESESIRALARITYRR